MSIATAASFAEQRRDIVRVSQLLKTAERMAGKQRTEDAIAAFTEAQESLTRHSGELDPKLKRLFDRAVVQIERTRADLLKSGLELPPLAIIDIATAEPPMERPRSGGETSDEVSFVNDVAPLFIGKCGRCHVQGSKGGLNLATYNNLMRGSKSGGIVVKGSSEESLIVQVIEGNEMPPSGEPVAQQVTQRLISWINAGAKFDGDDPDKPLAQLTRVAGNRPPPPKLLEPPTKIPMAMGEETVSFALDIAPILSESCTGCHGTNRTRAMLSVANFEQLWKGGDSGSMIAPGNPDRSLLVQKLRGTAPDGDRMPQGNPPLSDDKIALVAKWIAEGARFDGPSVGESTSRVTAIVRANRATSEELSALRADEAKQTWHLAIPDEQASRATSERFLVVGNLPAQRLEQLAQQAETEATRILGVFRQSDDPLNKARITLFAFSKRID
ncbi:MAG: c-type cytochrome domain-containing protein, partial [Aeoliella sp.]